VEAIVKRALSQGGYAGLHPCERNQIESLLLIELFQRIRAVLAANLGAMTLVLVVLWRTADLKVLAAWAGSMTVLTLARIALARVFLAQPRNSAAASPWALAFAAGAAASGILWGSAVLLFLHLEPAPFKLSISFCIAALSAVAVVGYSHNMRSFYAFTFPALLPYGLTLSWPHDGLDVWMVALFAIWLAAICVLARLQHGQAGMAKAFQLENERLIARLTSARDVALSANAAKTNFLANMSHELRTPLNAIIGFAEMMTAGVLGPIGNARYEPYTRDILESGRHLLHIVDEVLDVARLEAGRTELSEATVEVSGLIAAAARLVAPQAEAERILLHVEVEPGLPPLRADETKLRQIILNLLSNALKYTPEGGRVLLRADAHADGLALAVADTGIGIAPSDLPRVTVPYAQLEHREHLTRMRAHKRDSGRTSTGLGLPLVKMLAELHGGRLEIESTLGSGTTARVVLPRERIVAREPVATA
jgi:signal transduction histidine kinase